MDQILSDDVNQDAHLLVVDDDDRIRTLLKKFLGNSGFRVSTAANAIEARQLMRGLSFDLLVMDVMMPGEDGFALTKSLREIDNVPIILLTARGNPDDRIEGLSLGADDYLSKPFEPRELVLRIRSILRRQSTQPRSRQIRFGEWEFDLERSVLSRKGERTHLTTGETALLTTLARRVGQPVSRDALAEHINAKSERAVDVQITRLRRKLEPDAGSPSFLITVRNRGYSLQAEPVSG
jgi:two-component system phosphate regulon response regulator OmpR